MTKLVLPVGPPPWMVPPVFRPPTLPVPPFEEILAGGRQAYIWDGKNSYDQADKHVELTTDLSRANLWCSRASLAPRYHMPVFDVDVPREQVEERVNKAFPVGDITWVPSTTEGHHHVYVDGILMEFTEYFEILMELASRKELEAPGGPRAAVVEPGYFKVSRRRGGSFVRMPHVKKGDIPGEDETGLNDGEPKFKGPATLKFKNLAPPVQLSPAYIKAMNSIPWGMQPEKPISLTDLAF